MCKNCNKGIVRVNEFVVVTKEMADFYGYPKMEGKTMKISEDRQCPCCGGLWRLCCNCGDCED